MNLNQVRRRNARSIFQAALDAADPFQAVTTALRETSPARGLFFRGRYIPLTNARVILLGAGKASALMAQAVERMLGPAVVGGCIVVKDGHGVPLRVTEVLEASHPVPDARGVAAANKIADWAKLANDRNIVVCCISGGASALTPMPLPGITLEQKQQLTRNLLASGATIQEMNTVRKHYSQFKGGHLARLARPARVLSLVLSDVIGDDLSTIGSGPTVPDETTIADAQAILQRYGVAPLPVPMRETPKARDFMARDLSTRIVCSLPVSLDAAEARARQLGYRPIRLSSTIDGETRDVARMHVAIAREILLHGKPARFPAAIISGGETTVTLRGDGLGGRNQEFALAAAIAMQGMPNVLAFSAGTDGTDGPTDAAGGFADGTTVARGAEFGLSAQKMLDNNDSYHFLQATNDLLKTGPTKTNVMDVRVILVG